ncbi:MAG TPA: hypothetical protein PLZ45_03900 [Ferruginibacter sp.]|nr:hypothetical protein [Ferruginibacter sp.]
MKNMKIMVGVLLLILAGCSSSRITSSWSQADTAPKKYNKILVLGLIRDQDRSICEYMEKHFAEDLKGLGYNAVSAQAQFGPKAFENMCEKDAVDKIRSNGADAVITIVLLDKSKEQYYVPAQRQVYPRSVYYRRFGGYYTTVWERIYTPGYYVTDTRYFWESNLYDMNTRDLVYSVQTESFDPNSSESLGHEYGKLIVENMVKKNVLAKQ